MSRRDKEATVNKTSMALRRQELDDAGGMILMDSAMNAIAYDRGAAVILGIPEQTADSSHTPIAIPKEILDVINVKMHAEKNTLVTGLNTEKGHFSCTTYLMSPHNGFLSQPLVALHFERDISTLDAIDRVAAKYHLTVREQEALIGIALGLTSKELAGRMNISPNTVKAFLRLIMIKMGSTTRSGIVGKILESQHEGC